jgi:uncharacterized protein (DUF433 family)
MSADEHSERLDRAMFPENPGISSELYLPLYSYAEADRIAGVSRGTSGRWLKGYRYWYSESKKAQAPITPDSGHEGGVSFVDLIEVVAADRLRSEGFSLKKIRQINEFCQISLGTDRPLVTEKFKFKGRDIFVRISDGYLMNVGRQRGMHAWAEALDPFLETLDYEDRLARRWWPLGRGEPIVVDPDYGFGAPVIAGTGVRTENIAERAKAKEPAEEIAYDFGVELSQVEAALRYEFPEAA